MKLTMKYGTTLLAILGANLCAAQTNGPLQATVWGKSLQGVQLSISMTNRSVVAGSSSALVATVTNASRNVARLLVTLGEPEVELLLTNASGLRYNLTPQPADSSRLSFELEPGKTSVSTTQAVIGKNIAPGDYTLTGTRWFFANGSNLKLESNPLKIQIK